MGSITQYGDLARLVHCCFFPVVLHLLRDLLEAAEGLLMPVWNPPGYSLSSPCEWSIAEKKLLDFQKSCKLVVYDNTCSPSSHTWEDSNRSHTHKVNGRYIRMLEPSFWSKEIGHVLAKHAMPITMRDRLRWPLYARTSVRKFCLTPETRFKSLLK